MFCEKCGMEDRSGGGAFCAYCGARLPEEEPDWEVAARRREAQGGGEAAPEKQGQEQRQYGDSCVHPGASRKRCSECGKELPASMLEDVCTMCTVRRRNREELKQGREADHPSAQKDRYDRSDEFDKSIFKGQHYYQEPILERVTTELYTRFNQARQKNPALQRAGTGANGAKKGCLIAAIIVAALFILPSAIGLIGSVAYSVISSNEEGVQEIIDIPAIPADEYIGAGTLDQLYNGMIVPSAILRLREQGITVSEEEIEAWHLDGAYCMVEIAWKEPLRVILVFDDITMEGYLVYLEADEEILFNYTWAISREGLLTEEGEVGGGLEEGLYPARAMDLELFF